MGLGPKGPPSGRPAGAPFWNASFGAARGIADVPSVDEAVAFFERGRTLTDR